MTARMAGGWRAAVSALTLCLALGSGAAKADEATPGENPIVDPRSDDEAHHVALDHPDTDALIAGLKAENARLADEREDHQTLWLEEWIARTKAEVRDPANAPWAERDDDFDRFRLWADCKPMLDLKTGLRSRPVSWRRSSFGAGPPEYVRSALSELIDQFLVEYLRVNEAACG